MKVMNPMFYCITKNEKYIISTYYSGNQEKSILNVLHTGVFYLLGDKQVFQFK